MQARELYFFAEGERVSCNGEYGWLFSELQTLAKSFQRSLYSTSADGRVFWFRVSGFLILETGIAVVFPKGYHELVPPDRAGQTAAGALLFRTLWHYRERKPEAKEWERQALQASGRDSRSNCIDEAMYILQDFIRNGYLQRRRTRISQRITGRVLWPQTIHKTVPLVTHRQAVYHEPYMKASNPVYSDMIQKIHRYLVAEVYRDWGWVTGVSAAVTPEMEPPCSQEMAQRVLADEIRQTYIQRETELFKAMRRYLLQRGSTDQQEQQAFLLTPDFQWIWEDMCGAVLGNRYEEMHTALFKAPVAAQERATIFSAGYKPVFEAQRPDLLCRHGTALHVLDAKYYDYRNSFPGLPDIVKQYFYHDTLRERLKALQAADRPPAGLTETAWRNYRRLHTGGNMLLLPLVDSSMAAAQIPAVYMFTLRLPYAPSLGGIDVWLLNLRQMMAAYTGQIEAADIREQFFAMAAGD
ncbi:LlaJI family restriction endonuclease [Selenomonas bovis]|uniref:LlaJI family restriction endonuclease n=1 Tax=Selenomonas bovis TaxID=416586 RepID=UPI003D059AD1